MSTEPVRARGAPEHQAPTAAPDRIEELVAALCAGGPRPTGSAGHAHARRVLVDALGEVEAAPYREGDLTIAGDGAAANVVAVVPGSEPHSRPLLLATHYDGPPGSLGAGDNAAAVAVLVALVPILAGRRLDRDVIVAFLDGGDPTAFDTPRATGLARFLLEERRHDLKAAIVVDRVGQRVDPTDEPPLLVVGSESEARLPGLLASLRPSLPAVAPVLRRQLRSAPIADELHRHAVPYLWISGGRAPWHRGPDDVPERLDREALDSMVPLLLALVDRLARTRLPGPVGDHDVDAHSAHAWRAWPRRDARQRALERLGGGVDPGATPSD